MRIYIPKYRRDKISARKSRAASVMKSASHFAPQRLLDEKRRQIRADKTAASDFESVMLDAAILRTEGYKDLSAPAVAQKLESAAIAVARANRVAAAASRTLAMRKPFPAKRRGLAR